MVIRRLRSGGGGEGVEVRRGGTGHPARAVNAHSVSASGSRGDSESGAHGSPWSPPPSESAPECSSQGHSSPSLPFRPEDGQQAAGTWGSPQSQRAAVGSSGYQYQWASAGIRGHQWAPACISGPVSISEYPWVSAGSSGQQWVAVGTNISEHWWALAGTSGHQQTSAGSSGHQWISVSVVIGGHQQASVSISDYPWVSVSISGHQWASVGTSISGQQWVPAGISEHQRASAGIGVQQSALDSPWCFTEPSPLTPGGFCPPAPGLG